MRVLLIAAAAATVTACTPRDNSGADRTLTQSPEAAVYGEPTVTGGAYDSIIYRVGRERGLAPSGAHGAQAGHAPAGTAADPAAPDTVTSDSAAQQTGGGPTH